jgi:hypothetical protein
MYKEAPGFRPGPNVNVSARPYCESAHTSNGEPYYWYRCIVLATSQDAVQLNKRGFRVQNAFNDVESTIYQFLLHSPPASFLAMVPRQQGRH